MSENISKLIKQFENDIVFDCHSLTARICRSEAGRSLVKIGQGSLRQIAEYLKLKCDRKAWELTIAWCTLLSYIEKDIDKQRSGPEFLDETQGWVDWAERFAD